MEKIWEKYRDYQGGRVLFVNEEEAYGCPWPYTYSNVYDRTPLVELSLHHPDPEDLYKTLEKSNISYILFSEREAYRLKSYGLLYWNDEQKQKFDLFWRRYVRPIVNIDHCWLFRIYPQQQAGNTNDVPCPIFQF